PGVWRRSSAPLHRARCHEGPDVGPFCADIIPPWKSPLIFATAKGSVRALGLATSPVKRSLLRGLWAALRAVGAASCREPSGTRWSIGVAALVLVVAGACFYFNARRYLPFMADDAFISLRYSERFLQGKGLTWNDGERVEGYSNITWVL